MQKWEYLEVKIRYDSTRKEYYHETSKGKIYGLQNILSGYGQGGWELVNIVADQFKGSRSAIMGSGGSMLLGVDIYEAFFKRSSQ